MTIALIDGDIVNYRCAASAEKDGLEIAIARVDKLMRDIIHETDADLYKVFLTGTNNFRYLTNPEYKANRKDVVKPQYLEQCGKYLIDEWNAEITDGYEADDALGINQTSSSIICTIDKDLLMIPGRHYNFVKKEFRVVSELEGYKHFYKQMLIGDRADNIQGIKGIGEVKAGKLIDPCIDRLEMHELVFHYYEDSRRFDMNADCLWIQRKENQRFFDL